MAANSDVGIANGALQALGSSGILAFDQNTPNARSVSQSYAMTRATLLRNYAWSFAIRRASVAALSTTTIDVGLGALFQYLLPNDYARLLRPIDQRVDWQIEGRYIVTLDASPLKFRYVADITDPAQFDASFVDVFQIALALDICEEVTGSTAKKQGLRQDYKDSIREARFANAIERDADVPLQDDYVLEMQSGVGGSFSVNKRP